MRASPQPSRRTVLRGAFGAVLGLPWLEALAQTATPPKRLVLTFSPNGTVYESWLPTQDASGLTLSTVLAPLEPVKSKLLVVGHVDMKSAQFGPGDGHGRGIAHLWTGTEMWGSPIAGSVWWAGGPSVDQVAADTLGLSTPFRSLELAVQPQGARVWDRMCYRGSAQPLPPLTDPAAVYAQLFSQDADPQLAALRRARRRSVLDFVGGELKRLSSTVSAADRVRLDAHATSVREVERRLDGVAQPLPSCQKPGAPAPVESTDPAQFSNLIRTQMDLLVLALTCDLTRVASLQLSSSTSAVLFSWLGVGVEHHELSHRPDADTLAKDQLTAIHRWYAEQMRYLLQKLDAVPERDGQTLLDHCLVAWGNELGRGNVHSHTDVPFVLAGGAGGAVRTGRLLDAQHRAHNDLMVSMLTAVGVNATSFGNPSYCAGALGGFA